MKWHFFPRYPALLNQPVFLPVHIPGLTKHCWLLAVFFISNSSCILLLETTALLFNLQAVQCFTTHLRSTNWWQNRNWPVHGPVQRHQVIASHCLGHRYYDAILDSSANHVRFRVRRNGNGPEPKRALIGCLPTCIRHAFWPKLGFSNTCWYLSSTMINVWSMYSLHWLRWTV